MKNPRSFLHLTKAYILRETRQSSENESGALQAGLSTAKEKMDAHAKISAHRLDKAQERTMTIAQFMAKGCSEVETKQPSLVGRERLATLTNDLPQKEVFV